MSIFLENRDIFNVIVSKWLTLFEIVQLDRAICSTELRPYFLSLLQTVPYYIPFNNTDHTFWKAQMNCLQWLVQRQMYNLQGPLSVHYLLWIQLIPNSTGKTLYGLNYLPFLQSLRELRLLGFTHAFNFAELSTICPKLIHLHLGNLYEVSTPVMGLPETLETISMENVRFCPELIQALLTAPKLKVWNCRYCDLFLTNQTLDDVQRALWHRFYGERANSEEEKVPEHPFEFPPRYEQRMRVFTHQLLQRIERFHYTGDLASIAYFFREFGPTERLRYLSIDIVHSDAKLSNVPFPAGLILSQCRQLRSLEIRRVSVDVAALLEAMIEYTPQLVSLSINHCHVKNVFVPPMVQTEGSGSTRYVNLTSLHLESLLTSNSRVVLETFLSVPSFRQSIKKLSLSFWQRLLVNAETMCDYEMIRQQLSHLESLLIEDKVDWWPPERLEALQVLFRDVSQVQVIGYSVWCPNGAKNPLQSGKTRLFSKGMIIPPNTI